MSYWLKNIITTNFPHKTAQCRPQGTNYPSIPNIIFTVLVFPWLEWTQQLKVCPSLYLRSMGCSKFKRQLLLSSCSGKVIVNIQQDIYLKNSLPLVFFLLLKIILILILTHTHRRKFAKWRTAQRKISRLPITPTQREITKYIFFLNFLYTYIFTDITTLFSTFLLYMKPYFCMSLEILFKHYF